MDRIPKIPASRETSTTDGEAIVIKEELVDGRDALLAAEPTLRGRTLADRLGVSEAQILMLECGHSACILRPEWPEIIGKVSSLGTVMAFTRNEWILHEKIGRYGGVSMNDSGNAVV